MAFCLSLERRNEGKEGREGKKRKGRMICGHSTLNVFSRKEMKRKK
jgi:hypothetical protein